MDRAEIGRISRAAFTDPSTPVGKRATRTLLRPGGHPPTNVRVGDDPGIASVSRDFFRENGGMADRASRIDTTEALRQFVAAINQHDIGAINALMTTDHMFVDSVGNRVQGASSMQVGWRSYFAMCSDYWIRTDHVMTEGDVVMAVGEAGGTIDGVSWRTPAAWKGLVREGKLAEWRVFADNKPVYEILSRRQQ